MKTQYVADDGTVFFEAKECAAYEKTLKECDIKKSHFWAGSKKPMSIEEFCSDPGNCDFIEVAKGEEEAVYRVLDKGGRYRSLGRLPLDFWPLLLFLGK